MEDCEICKKKLSAKESDEGICFYYEWEIFLCRKHYKAFEPIHNQIWKDKKLNHHQKCVKSEKELLNWIKAQKSTTPKKAGHNTRFKKERVLDNK